MRYYYLVFAIVALILISPFLLGKYFLSLDTVLGPNIKIEDRIYGLEDVSTNLPYIIVIKALSYVMPTFIIQKMIIFLIFFLSGISMYNLIQTKSSIPRYFAAFVYMINPFVFSRFLAGHHLLLLGYAIMPFAIGYILKKGPDKKSALLVTLIGIISIHYLVLSLLAIIIILNKKILSKKFAYFLFIILVLNLFWILPLAYYNSKTYSEITARDFNAFSSGSLIDVLLMKGFWREQAYNLYFFDYFSVIILILSIIGFFSMKKLRVNFIIIAVFSIILASGFFDFRLFRDPQKFVGLLVLSYCYFSAHTVERLKKYSFLAFIVPLVFTLMFFSFHSTDYPADYYEINDYLNQDDQDFKVVFLPWHQYMDFSWLPNKDKRLANPAKVFFDKPVIQGDNMELQTIFSSSRNPVSLYIEHILKNSTKNLGNKLALINVKYVILAKEVDYKNYYFLNQLEKIKETEHLVLYKNPENVSRFYQVDTLSYYHNFSEIGNVLRSVYILSNKTDITISDYEPLSYKKISPIKYELEKPEMKYVIFTEGYDPSWNMEYKDIIINAKEFDGNLVVKNDKFIVYLIGYLISLTFLLFLSKIFL